MSVDDEPVLGRKFDHSPLDSPILEPLRKKIGRLVTSQPYGVLCTQGDGQPYGSLVAFAFSADLKRVVFATPTATRKYRLLSECERVALLVDNRPDFTHDMMQVEAVTVTGKARQVEAKKDVDRCSAMLLGRHPYLKHFVESESSALIEIEVTRFLHVTRFQEVNQWVPGGG